MQIDHDERGNPHAILVSVSPANGPGADGKFFTVFIPISEILALRHADLPLIGHPWLDVPSDEIIALNISRADHNFITRHLDLGRYIAIRAVGKRGKYSRGCYLDNQGDPIVKYRFSWRKPEKYIPDPIDMFWLQEFSKESARYADKIFLIEAISGHFQRLWDKIAKEPKKKPLRAKKKRLRAKDRRRLYEK